MRTFWISGPRMTVAVDVDERDIIRDAAPIIRKFIGQPLVNLTGWLGRHGSVSIVELSPGVVVDAPPR